MSHKIALFTEFAYMPGRATIYAAELPAEVAGRMKATGIADFLKRL